MRQRKASLAARLVISDYIAFILKSLTHKFTTYTCYATSSRHIQCPAFFKNKKCIIKHVMMYLVGELFTNSTSLISNQYNINVRLAEQLALHEDF